MKIAKKGFFELIVLLVSVVAIGATPFVFNPLPESTSNALSKLLGEIGGAADDVIAVIQNATKTGSASAENIADLIKNVTGTLLQDAVTIGNQIEAHSSELIKRNINGFQATLTRLRTELQIRRQNIRNLAKQAIISRIEDWVQSVAQLAENVQQRIDEVKETWNDNINKQSAQLLSDWNVWASNVLERVYRQTDGNEELMEAAENIINELVNTYSVLINNCVEGVSTDLENYQMRVTTALSNFEGQINELIIQLEECIQTNNNTALSSDCKTELINQLQNLQTVPVTIIELNLEGLKLSRPNFIKTPCVRQTLADFALQKLRTEKKIADLIKNGIGSSTSATDVGNTDESGANDSTDNSAGDDNTDGSSADSTTSA
ncbi:uncharacterized protein LOC119688534 [Teleopsis dalmanni]|uniref:uncharacterized protein LOC119688534 n=1 Tax=Teleopsis dalmanni TaxID=139649 RepID=UPI0018CCC8EE|nr:uncharacterized protein LOC119688534 [Teleopsis dalmanni]